MDLVLWRHAEAHELSAGAHTDGDDLSRRLTGKGIKQARRMGAWLDLHLPATARVLCSPAVRTVQTAEALGRSFQIKPVLAPDASPMDVRMLVNWPLADGVTLVVGHQPTLGQLVAQVLGLQAGECAIKKGSVWWLRHRIRDGVGQTVLVTVQSPELV
jgi:phosphohistidine phosphatase